MELISRVAALDVLVTSPNFHTTLTRIEELPAVDAVPVVRCKDCKFRDVTGPYPVCELDSADLFEQTRNADEDDWFCAEGERRDES